MKSLSYVQPDEQGVRVQKLHETSNDIRRWVAAVSSPGPELHGGSRRTPGVQNQAAQPVDWLSSFNSSDQTGEIYNLGGMVLSFILVQNRQWVIPLPPWMFLQFGWWFRLILMRLNCAGARRGWRSGMRHTVWVSRSTKRHIPGYPGLIGMCGGRMRRKWSSKARFVYTLTHTHLSLAKF